MGGGSGETRSVDNAGLVGDEHVRVHFWTEHFERRARLRAASQDLEDGAFDASLRTASPAGERGKDRGMRTTKLQDEGASGMEVWWRGWQW